MKLRRGDLLNINWAVIENKACSWDDGDGKRERERISVGGFQCTAGCLPSGGVYQWLLNRMVRCSDLDKTRLDMSVRWRYFSHLWVTYYPNVQCHVCRRLWQEVTTDLRDCSSLPRNNMECRGGSRHLHLEARVARWVYHISRTAIGLNPPYTPSTRLPVCVCLPLCHLTSGCRPHFSFYESIISFSLELFAAVAESGSLHPSYVIWISMMQTARNSRTVPPSVVASSNSAFL